MSGDGRQRLPEWAYTVERLGGWVVVCFIVYWLTTRWELRMDQLADALTHSMEATISNSRALASSILEAIRDTNDSHQQSIKELVLALKQK